MNDSPRDQRRRAVTVTPRRPPAELRAVRAIVVRDDAADISYLEQEELRDRRAAYRRRAFEHVVIRIEADVHLADTDQLLLSPGIGGVESDVLDEELAQAFSEEWEILRGVLKAVGVSTEQLPLEFDPKWIEWRT